MKRQRGRTFRFQLNARYCRCGSKGDAAHAVEWHRRAWSREGQDDERTLDRHWPRIQASQMAANRKFCCRPCMPAIGRTETVKSQCKPTCEQPRHNCLSRDGPLRWAVPQSTCGQPTDRCLNTQAERGRSTPSIPRESASVPALSGRARAAGAGLGRARPWGDAASNCSTSTRWRCCYG